MIFKVYHKILIGLVLVLGSFSGLFAVQAPVIDSLKQVLRSTNESETVDILNELSEIHLGTDWGKSQRYASLALDLAGSLGDIRGMGIAHANLAIYYNNEADYRNALDHAALGLTQLENLSDAPQIARILRTIGTTYSLLNQSDQSLDYYLRALMIFEDIEQMGEVAATLMLIGEVYSQWGQTEKSLRFVERALSIYNDINDLEGVLTAENRFAQSLMTLLRFEEAKEHLEQALVISDDYSDPPLLAKLYTSLGELYYYQFQLNTALKYFQDALDLKQEQGNPGEIAVALSDVGSIHQEAGEIEKALSFYQRGQKIAEESGEQGISSEIYLLIGELYMNSGKKDKAIEAMLSSLNIAQQNHDLRTIQRANHMLTTTYSRYGQADIALTYQKALQQTRDEIYVQQSNQNVAELEVRYELDKREKELGQMMENALIKDLEFQRRFTVMWIILAFSVGFLILIAAFIFYRGRIIRHAEQEKMEHELRLKADFTAMLVHDLRSPLTSVFGFAELLKMGEKPFERIKEIANTIRETSQKMLQLVNEMLDLSKFEAGKMVLTKTRTALKPIISSSIQMLDPVANQRKTSIRLEAEDGIEACYCDPRKIEQVITNFISNAITHTPEGSEIVVNLNAQQQKGQTFLYFSVADDGPGVESSQKEKIFDKYAQLETRKSGGGLGTGLGLAVSQMIIEQHNGEVGYRDREPKGSIFYFQIPTEDNTKSKSAGSDETAN